VLSLDSARDGLHCIDNVESNYVSKVGDKDILTMSEKNETIEGHVAEADVSCEIAEKIAPEFGSRDVSGGRRASLQTQPESEADVLPPSGSPQEQSTCLTDEAEPAREPQPLESPREFAWCAPNPRLEELEPEVVASVSSAPDSPSAEAERSTDSDDSCLPYAPRACEEGMQRSQALLPQLLQFEMNRELRIIVPDGMDAETRQVSFTFENKQHTVTIPENFDVGMEVPITISKRPALEPNQRVLMCRGLSSSTTDRCSIVDSLRHGARPVGNEQDCLNSQEFKHRQFLYSLLRGNAMHPLLPWTPEDDGEANTSDLAA